MADLSLDLRRRVVNAYLTGLTETYEATAEMFGIGEATVSRLLRRRRETGDVLPRKRGGDRRRVVDLVWLEEHARANPDARLLDRMAAWKERTGGHVSMGAMWAALDAIGWTHKKRLPSRSNATGRTCRPSESTSSANSRSWTSRG